MKQSKAQLKAWFRRGKYPTEEQFADWMDSYHHKDEQVPLASVEGLTDRLNGKYNRTEGEELERKHDKLSADFEEHKKENENDFKNVREAIADEEERATTEETRLDGEIKKETARATGVENDLRTDLTAAVTDIDKIREMLNGGATLDEAKAALVALGNNYKDLHAVANTLKTFLEAKDTADSTINRWKEIESFLSGITDTKTLSGLLQELETKITAAYTAAITNQTVTFTAAESRTAPATGEKLSTIIGKIVKWLKDLKAVAFSGSAADVAETDTRKFVTPAEKSTWSGKADRTELPGAITEEEIGGIFNQ